MKHLRSFFAVLLAAAVCAAVVLFSGCGASVQVQQLTIPGERGSILCRRQRVPHQLAGR